MLAIQLLAEVRTECDLWQMTEGENPFETWEKGGLFSLPKPQQQNTKAQLQTQLLDITRICMRLCTEARTFMRSAESDSSASCRIQGLTTNATCNL